MNKVIVLGAGGGQAPMINEFKKLGMRVVVIGMPGDSPGFQLADIIYHEDVRSREAILEIAMRERIRGICTDQLDMAVETAAYVSEKLGLPSIGHACSVRFTDKQAMREAAARLGIHSPAFETAGDLTGALKTAGGIGYPVMIKPVDSDGSRGVFRVNNDAELEALFDECMAFSKKGRIIIEEFVEGELFEIQGIAVNGKHQNLCIASELYFRLENIFLPRAMLYKDALHDNSEIEERVLAENDRLINGFELPFGITQTEFIHSRKDGRIYLVETAARGGGVYISSDLIPLSCGINANEMLAKMAVGIPCPEPPFEMRRGAAAYFCFLLPEGTVADVRISEKLASVAGIHKVFLNGVKAGDKTPPVINKSSRRGPILVYGETRDACIAIGSKLRELIQIDVKTPSGVVRGIDWE